MDLSKYSLVTSTIFPLVSFITLSQIERAWGLWVIIIHVGLCERFLTDSITLNSVSGSKEEVASSSINIGFFLRNALAIPIRWACPSDIPVPFSPIIVSNPSSSLVIKSKAQASFVASIISDDDASSLPNLKLSEIVPENKVLPWGT